MGVMDGRRAPYPGIHDGLEPQERGDAVVLGGLEPRRERRRAPLRRQHPRRRLLRHVEHDPRVRLPHLLHLRGNNRSAHAAGGAGGGFRERNFTWESAIPERRGEKNCGGRREEGRGRALVVAGGVGGLWRLE